MDFVYTLKPAEMQVFHLCGIHDGVLTFSLYFLGHMLPKILYYSRTIWCFQSFFAPLVKYIVLFLHPNSNMTVSYLVGCANKTIFQLVSSTYHFACHFHEISNLFLAFLLFSFLLFSPTYQ